MEMAFVMQLVGSVWMGSLTPIPVDDCTAMQQDNPQVLCVDVEPACGKGTGKPCLGRADDPPRKVRSSKRYHRKTSFTQAAMFP